MSMAAVEVACEGGFIVVAAVRTLVSGLGAVLAIFAINHHGQHFRGQATAFVPLTGITSLGNITASTH